MKYMVYLGTAVLLLLLIAGCSQPAQQNAQQPLATAGATPAPEETTAAATAALVTTTKSTVSDNTISIREMSFDPAEITVPAGSIVRWVNRDAEIHSIVFSDTRISSSGVLSSSQSFSVKLNTPGTYPYHCGMHPTVTGTIIVTG